MIHYESTFSTRDGTRLYEQGWKPDGRIRSTVALIHGYADHSGRYRNVAQALVRRGYEVAAFDLRGFGRSGGRAGYVGSVDTCLDDVVEFVSRVQQRAGPNGLFVFGHSFGGALATLYCVKHSAAVRGVLLSSPAIRLCEPGWLQALSQTLGVLLPLLPTVRLNRTLVSCDPHIVQDALRDPLVYQGRVLARTGASLVDSCRRLRSCMTDLTLPFLAIHGTADRLTDPRGSQELYSASRSTDKTLSLFEGLLHETFNEPDGVRVLDQVAEWLEERS